MTIRKARMTVTVDRALIEAASEAVASGRAASLSTWVNTALAERAAKERHLRALADAIAGYEAEFGVISDTEMTEQQREDRRASVVLREPQKKPVRHRRRKAA